MPVAYGVIVAPVDAGRDVAYILGASSKDIEALCLHPSINMWSAKKPVEHNDPWRTTDQKFAELNYGLSTGKKTVSAIAVDYSGFYWSYQKPQTWFRLLDFDGYNHSAMPPEVNMVAYPVYVNNPSENGRILVDFPYDGGEIRIMDIPVKTTTQGAAPSEELSEWHLVFIIYVGNRTPQLYNTGQPLEDFFGTFVDISGAFLQTDVGTTAVIVPALAYPNAQMAVGLNTITGSFMSQYYVVPLSFTPSMEANMQVLIDYYYWLVNMTIANTQIIQPQPGANTYKFSSVGITATQNNTGSGTCKFTLKLGLRRTVSGVTTTYYSLTLLDQTLTTPSSSSPYQWEFTTSPDGYINFSPSFRLGDTSTYTTAQSGDVLFLEATLYNNSGNLQTVTKNVLTVS